MPFILNVIVSSNIWNWGMKFHKKINLISGAWFLLSPWKFTFGQVTPLWNTLVPKFSVETGWSSPIKVCRDYMSPSPSSQSTLKDLAAPGVHVLFALTLVILHCISKSETWEKYKVCVSEELCETRSWMTVKHITRWVKSIVKGSWGCE